MRRYPASGRTRFRTERHVDVIGFLTPLTRSACSAVRVPSSDPARVVPPIYRRLAAEGSFEQLASATKFARLMDAAAAVSESKVAQLRRASPAAQSALLAHLAMMEAERPTDTKVSKAALAVARHARRITTVCPPSGSRR